MEIKPIKTEADYHNALKEIDALWGAEINSPEGDKLDVLMTLTEAWESQHYPIDEPDPIEHIHFIMEQKNMSRKDLEPYIGPRGRVSDVLNRKRSLTLNMIRRLHDGLGIPADVLIQNSTHQTTLTDRI